MRINVKKALSFVLQTLFILVALVLIVLSFLPLEEDNIFVNYYNSLGFEWVNAIRTVFIVIITAIALGVLCLMIRRLIRRKQTLYHANAFFICGVVFFITSGGIAYYSDFIGQRIYRHIPSPNPFPSEYISKPVQMPDIIVDGGIVPGRVIVHVARVDKEKLRTYLIENKILSEEGFPEDSFPSQAEDPEFFLILKVEDGKEKYWADKIRADLPFVKSAEFDYYGEYF